MVLHLGYTGPSGECCTCNVLIEKWLLVAITDAMMKTMLSLILLLVGMACLICGVFNLCYQLLDLMALRRLCRRDGKKCVGDASNKQMYRRRLLIHSGWCLTWFLLSIVFLVAARTLVGNP